MASNNNGQNKRQLQAQLDAFKAMEKIIQKALRGPDPIPIPKLRTDPDYNKDVDRRGILAMVPEPMVVQINAFMTRHPQLDKQALMQKMFRTLLENQQTECAKIEFELKELTKNSTQDEEEADPEDDVEDLPWEINRAANKGDAPAVLEWLGANPPSSHLNAKCRQHVNRTLLHEATFNHYCGLMSVLLQMGAKVDPKSTLGLSPLEQALTLDRLVEPARLLLTWGATFPIDGFSIDQIVDPKLKRLLKMPLGGRRCEVVGLQGRADLNGKKGIAFSYDKTKERYGVQMEHTDEKVLIRPINLQRHDRTPEDCGPYVTFSHDTSDGTGIYKTAPM